MGRGTDAQPTGEPIIVLILFAVTIFTGAALLFLVQPMFARMVLPLVVDSATQFPINSAFR
jgi:hypothetical protein